LKIPHRDVLPTSKGIAYALIPKAFFCLPPFSCLGGLQGSPFLNTFNLELNLTRLSPSAKVAKVEKVEALLVCKGG